MFEEEPGQMPGLLLLSLFTPRPFLGGASCSPRLRKLEERASR